MIIKVIRNYNFPALLRQSPLEKGEWNGVHFSETVEKNYNFLICLNPPSSQIVTHLPKKRIWLLTQEPPIDSWTWHRNVFKYFGRIYTQHEAIDETIVNIQTCLPWHINKTFDELTKLEPGAKNKNISSIISSYNNTPLQNRRVEFIKYLKREQFKIDVFGKGVKYLEDKFDGLFPYKYSICIENSAFKHYWTEKLADCFLSFTMPVYYGCLNLTEYFPEGSFIQLDINDFAKSKHIIENAILNKEWEKNFDKIVEARNLILYKYQFFPFVAEKINQEKENIPPFLRTYTIPPFLPPRPGLLRKLKNYGKRLF